MKFMCPYCSVSYTLETPCFCQPKAEVYAQPSRETLLLPVARPRHAPEIALAALLAVRLNRLQQMKARA